MAKTTRLLATAGMLLAAMAAPPASADQPEWIGFTCGFISTNDPTGVINQDPNAQTGVMNTGPIMVAADLLDDNTSLPSVHFPLESPTTILQKCWIQVNKIDYNGGPPISTAYCEFNSIVNGVPGPSVMLQQACTIAYSAGPTDNVYICTKWYLIHDATGTHDHYRWDDPTNTAIHHSNVDPNAVPNYNSARCALAISAGA